MNRTWDPIASGQPDDEYDGYIGEIYRMIVNNVPIETLSQHLRNIETRSMGLRGDPVRARTTAQQLLALCIDPELQHRGPTL